MLTILHGTALEQDIARVRSSTTPIGAFRQAVHRIGLHLAVEVSKHLPARQIEVTTPLERTSGTMIDGDVVLMPVLRAGLGLLDPFLQVLPDASVGYIGLKRDEVSLEAREYYKNFPPLSTSTTAIILDPMLATGGSMTAVLDHLRSTPLREILIACLIAAPEGINCVQSAYPTTKLFVATQDRCLNEHGYIVPGLGDAGDRLFGTT
ncbi:MAG: uracil phosphoribosyltransferase [Bacteroidetes bacterium]|nr:uracil phosphoribosyltransferase [Bacteroidota bacterium]